MSESNMRDEFESITGYYVDRESFYEGWERASAHKDAEFAKEREQLRSEIERLNAKIKSAIKDDFSDLFDKLSEVRALIAMQAEALKRFGNHRLFCSTTTKGSNYGCNCGFNEALSTSAESVAEWEARKLEPLRSEVAMLRDVLLDLQQAGNEEDDAKFYAANKKATTVLRDTQATAEAYEREHTAKVLRDFGATESEIREQLELRAQSAQKGG